MKRVYVAGKLNDKDAVGYLQNCHHMLKMACMIRSFGFAVYIPCIDLLAGIYAGNWAYDDYLNNSMAWLEASDVMFVLAGWEDSPGTKREMQLAHELKIPICYTLSELLKHYDEAGTVQTKTSRTRAV